MILKYLIFAAIVVRFTIGDSSFIFDLPTPSKSPSEEKNWTVIYSYDLDEIADELTEFRRCMTKFTDLCQSSNTPSLCAPFCGFIDREIGWIQTRLDYIKSYDVFGSKKHSDGRKNTFKMQTIGETTYINGEHPSTFAQILKLNQKIGLLSKCRKCNINIDDFRDIISSISTIQLQKVNEMATALEYSRANKCDRAFFPIALQRQFSYLIEVEQFMQAHSSYEIIAGKFLKLANDLFEVAVVHNTFRVKVSVPIMLKDCIRKRHPSTSIFGKVQSSGQIQFKN